MTQIKRLSAKGFKSFAGKTELEFGNGFNIVIGPNGSGKSLRGDSRVLLPDGSSKEIKELVDNKIKNSKEIKKLDDGIYTESRDDDYILSVNPTTFRQEYKKIIKYIKHNGEKKLYEITTRTGKKITTTGCHSIIIFKEGHLNGARVDELKEKDLIALPRTIRTIPKNDIKIDIQIDSNREFPHLATPNFGRFIGYIIGDGYLNQRLELINSDAEILEDFKALSKELFKIDDFYIRKTGITSRFIDNSSDIKKFLQKLFKSEILTGEHKAIPEELMIGNDNITRNLLAGLFDTDGHVSENGNQIEFSNKNQKLVMQIQELLLRFGIISSIKMKYKYATNTEKKIKRKYYFLNIYSKDNLQNFYNNIHLIVKHKKERLEKYIRDDVETNTNVDFLPKEINLYIKEIVRSLGLKVKNLRKEYPSLASYYENRCYSSRYKLKDLIELFTDRWFDLYQVYKSLEMNTVKLVDNLEKINISGTQTASILGVATNTVNISWKNGVFNAKPQNLERLYNFEKEFLEEHLDYSLKLLTLLNRIASSEIFWDEIIKVEKVNGEEYVYDIEVEDNHNFIANGMYVHNSNIVDALCFVLGKSSAKEMRAEKSSNLIFNGGKKQSPSKEAEVMIEFDNSLGKFPLKEKDVRITRTVKQNGTSVYMINDEVRTRQQVLDLLNAAKIDPDGHNIILQGDIIHFMEMKSTDRRQIIEEIAGISIYEEKKGKCLQELEKVDSKLNEAGIILTEREANLRELKKERDQAIKYKEIQESIKDDRATYTHLQIKNKQEKIDEIEGRKKEAENKISKINEEINNHKTNINNHKDEIKKINEEIEVKGAKDQLTLRKDIEDIKTNTVKSNSRLEVCNTEVVKIKQRKEQLLWNIKEIEEKIKELQLKKKAHDSDIITLVNREKEIDKKIQTLKEKSGIDNETETIEKLEKEIEKKQEEINRININRQELIRNKDQLTYKLNSTEERINNLKGSTKDVEELKNNKRLFKEITEKLAKCLNEDSSYAAQLSRSRHELMQSNEELAKLTTRQVSIQERAMGDLAVRKIIELKNSVKGIHGIVSTLGNVEGKYSQALEVAAGSRIQSIVVDSDTVAQKCIEHLKMNKLGVATFLPLNKVKSRVMDPSIKDVLKSNGVQGLATDLVSYDPMYADIFSYVFGTTVIVDSIEIARRIGIGKARMVTLDGDLLEPSGAMIGGYRMQKAGLGFKEKEVDNNINKLDVEVKKLSVLVSNLENKRTENEVMISSLRENKAELEGNIIRMEKTLNVEGYDINSLIEEKKSLINTSKEQEKNIENVDKELNKTVGILEDLKEKKTKLREKLNDPELIKNFDVLEEQRMKTKESILEINSNIKNIEVQVTSMLNPEKEKTEKIIKQQEKENEEFLKETIQIKDILKNMDSELKIKENEEKKFHSNFKTLIDKRNKFTEKIQTIDNNLVREEERIKEHEQKLNNISIDRAKIIAEMEGLQKEFENYKDATIKRGVNYEELQLRIRENEKLLNSIGNVNLRALEVYEGIQKEYTEVVDKVTKLKVEKDDVLNVMNEVESRKKEIFMKTYNQVTKKFKEIFSSLNTKGEVQVELENPEDPFAGGVDIQVKIAGNKHLDLKSLSGGEKTMTALSFIFAIQEFAPSPFYLLDEVDAALDKRNAELLSQLIKKYSDKAQYLVISHNDHVIHEGNFVYGVTMQDGVSKVVSMKV